MSRAIFSVSASFSTQVSHREPRTLDRPKAPSDAAIGPTRKEKLRTQVIRRTMEFAQGLGNRRPTLFAFVEVIQNIDSLSGVFSWESITGTSQSSATAGH